jgi:hypothetical protein
LKEREPNRGERHREVQIERLLRVHVDRAAIPQSAIHAREALHEHRHEDQVHEHERPEEVDLAERLVHHAARDFRKPVVDAGKEREDRPGRH